MTLPADRTNTIALVGLTLLTPLLVAAATDPRLASYAMYLIALKSALTDLGFLFARGNKISDQQAGARIETADGKFVDAKPAKPFDYSNNLGGTFVQK